MTQRTYWHLEKLGRKPSAYDIASSNLLYYVERGFETNLPIADWYRRYQRESAFTCRDWEQFEDPRETTYTKYTELQRTKEAFVDGVLQAADDSHYDQKLSPTWLGTLERILPPLRYPMHGLQMIAAYVGHMAPNGRIVIASLFQAADELRRVQRFAYRMRQLQDVAAGFGVDSRTEWEADPIWQPLREIIERLLVTYDWGEAFIATSFALKPRFDALFMTQLAELARSSGDSLLGNLLFSLDEDCRWHREWSRELVRIALCDRPQNREPIAAWLARWNPLATRAIEAFAPLFGPDACAAALASYRVHSAGLEPGEGG